MRAERCIDCGHLHRGGYCAEVCRLCIAEERDDFDADELGIDPEEEYDA